MRHRFIISMCALLLSSTGLARAEEDQWIDLTHDLSADAIFWPTAQAFEMTTDFAGITEGGYYYSAYSFTTAEHGGTHIDAPVHFAEGKRPVNEIPLRQLIGDAVVVDVSLQVAKNRDQLPATGAYVIALPVKIRGGSGGPLRIIARVAK